MTDAPLALVTGSTRGLGRATSAALLTRGYHVILAYRNEAQGQILQDQLNQLPNAAGCVGVTLDLASLSSVKSCAEAICAQYPRLDLLINNAGVMGGPLTFTNDGFEQQMGVNHLGHFALMLALKPLLLAAHTPRIISVSSSAHKYTTLNLKNLNAEQGYKPWQAYAQSKLANLLFISELQRRLPPNGFANAVHPGYVATGLTTHVPLASLGNRLLATTPGEAVQHVLYAIAQNNPRGYFGPSGWLGLRGKPAQLTPSQSASDASLAAELWSISENLTQMKWSD